MHRSRHRRPRRGFLGHHQHAGMVFGDHGVQLAQEFDRLQILAAAVAIGHPLPRRARVVEIEHRRHRIHAQSVHVVLVQPEQRVGEEEVPHFVPAVVENQGAPLAVLTLAGIGMFVERGAVH